MKKKRKKNANETEQRGLYIVRWAEKYQQPGEQRCSRLNDVGKINEDEETWHEDGSPGEKAAPIKRAALQLENLDAVISSTPPVLAVHGSPRSLVVPGSEKGRNGAARVKQAGLASCNRE